MNEIYKLYWNPLQNFFTPSMKLKEKTRVGGRIVKRYDPPMTPYQRLVTSGQLTQSNQMLLRHRRENESIRLKARAKKKLKWLFKIVDIQKQN